MPNTNVLGLLVIIILSYNSDPKFIEHKVDMPDNHEIHTPLQERFVYLGGITDTATDLTDFTQRINFNFYGTRRQ